MVIVLTRIFVRPGREDRFLANYRSEVPVDRAFLGETLAQIPGTDSLPAGVAGLLKPVEGCINYVSVARWSERPPFAGHRALSEHDYDPEVEVRPRQRMVLEVVDDVRPGNRWLSYRSGVWFWGFVLSVWLMYVGIELVVPGTWWSPRLSENGTLAAAVTAVLGVIWSWFLQLDSRQS